MRARAPHVARRIAVVLLHVLMGPPLGLVVFTIFFAHIETLRGREGVLFVNEVLAYWELSLVGAYVVCALPMLTAGLIHASARSGLARPTDIVVVSALMTTATATLFVQGELAATFIVLFVAATSSATALLLAPFSARILRPPLSATPPPVPPCADPC